MLRIKERLPHGAWTPVLKERGISKSTAHQFIQLRQKYPEMSQLGTFRIVQAVLTDSKKSSEGKRAAPTTRQHDSAYLVSADDLWDWERGEVSTLARRHGLHPGDGITGIHIGNLQGRQAGLGPAPPRLPAAPG